MDLMAFAHQLGCITYLMELNHRQVGSIEGRTILHGSKVATYPTGLAYRLTNHHLELASTDHLAIHRYESIHLNQEGHR